jgi:hypothetical protein
MEKLFIIFILSFPNNTSFVLKAKTLMDCECHKINFVQMGRGRIRKFSFK